MKSSSPLLPFVSGQDSKGVLSQNTDKLKHVAKIFLFGYEVLDNYSRLPFVINNLITKRLKALITCTYLHGHRLI